MSKTIEEMDAVIQQYCAEQGFCPTSCKLKSICEPIKGDFLTNPTVCEEAYRIVTNGNEPENQPNPYWDNITALATKQRKKGLHDYGQGLEANNKPVVERIKYIEEELIDALMYLEWLKDSLVGVTKEETANEEVR